MEDIGSLSAIMKQALFSSRAEVRRAFESANEVVIFGSTAGGLRRPNSDLDILCISDRTWRFKDATLDFLCLSESDAVSVRWAGSELANHIVRYGVWMNRQTDWVERVHLDERAALLKRRRLESYAGALSRRWDRLGDSFRRKYMVKLRRETQRLLLLDRQIAVPPTALLDNAWFSDSASYNATSSALQSILQTFGMGKLAELEAGILGDRVQAPIDCLESTAK